MTYLFSILFCEEMLLVCVKSTTPNIPMSSTMSPGAKSQCRFTRRYSRWFTDYAVTTAAKSDANRLVAFGTKEGILSISILTGCENILEGHFQTLITESSIVDAEWLGSGTIGVAAMEENIYSYDVVKDVASSLTGHKASIKCIKRRDENVFFSGSRDGYAYGWDKRSNEICYVLKHNPNNTAHFPLSTVGSIEFNSRENAIVYTSSTPGGMMNMWDLRYLKNGQHFPESHTISHRSIESLKYCKNNLYAMDTDISVFRISQSGLCHKSIYRAPSPGSMPLKLHFSEYLDLLLCVSNETLFCISPDSGIANMNRIDGLTDILPLEFGNLMGYDSRGSISEFVMHINSPSVSNTYF